MEAEEEEEEGEKGVDNNTRSSKPVISNRQKIDVKSESRFKIFNRRQFRPIRK